MSEQFRKKLLTCLGGPWPEQSELRPVLRETIEKDGYRIESVTYDAIHRTQLLHCFPNFIPGVVQFGDTPDIVKLIAPRPLHMNFGELDKGSPIREVR